MTKMKTTLWAVGAVLLSLVLTPARAADLDYVENSFFSNTVAIVFSGASATVVNGAGSGVICAQTNANLVITSSVAGVEYILSGASSGGYLKLQSLYAARVALNGVNLTCTNGPALSLLSSNRCFLVLPQGATNSLTDATTYTQSGDGALYASAPLIVSGRGSLNVTGKKKNGIYAGSYLRLVGGDVSVLSAAKDGVHSIQYFRMDNGSLSVASTGDAIDADAGYVVINGGRINVQSASDDVKGIKCAGTLTMNGGAVNMTVSGVQSKGFKSSGVMTFNDGTVMLSLSGAMYLQLATNSTTVYVDPSYCTGIKCDTNITFNGGNFTVTHTGTAGKGISADGNINIYGGTFDLVTTGGYSSTYTNDEGVLDLASSDCLKADGNLTILAVSVI